MKIQPAAVKEESRFEVFTVSEATNSAFDGHDSVVKSFGSYVGDFQKAVVIQIGESLLDGPSEFPERIQVSTDNALRNLNARR